MNMSVHQIVEIHDMQYFDVPNDLLDTDTLVHEALTEIVPQRVPFGSQAPIDECAAQVRKRAGKKAIKKFVRANFPDYVERTKDMLSRYKFHDEAALSDVAVLEMRKAYDPRFDPLTSSPRLRVIYKFLVKSSWWL